MEEETRRELASLQREKELLQAKEKENEDAIDEVRMPLIALLTARDRWIQYIHSPGPVARNRSRPPFVKFVLLSIVSKFLCGNSVTKTVDVWRV